MDESMTLSECVGNLVTSWLNTHKQEANKGNIESMLILSDLLIKQRPPDVPQAIHWLKKSCYSSPESAFKLAKLYLKGKIVRKDISKAFFYLKLTTLFKCRCGKQSDLYHDSVISNVHPCFPHEANLALSNIQLTPRQRKKCEDDFNNWKAANLN